MSANPAATRHDVQALYDRVEIVDLVHRLGVCLDEGRFDELRTLVVEEATVRTPGGQAEGREALVAQARRNHPSDQRFQHLIANVAVDLDGDAASVRANLVVHIITTARPTDVPAPPPLASIGEVYRFRLLRTPDGWRFSHIETVPLWLSGTLPPRPAA